MAGLRSRSVDGNGLNSPSFSPQFDKDSNTKISRSRSSSPNKFDPSMTKFAFFLMLEIDTRSDAFKKFLSFEYCDENLSFWRATFDYRHMAIKASRMKRKRRAQEIVKQFIVDDAPEMINISGKVRQIILKEVLHGRTCHSGMFNKAVEEVEQMLVMGPFPRFASKTDKIIHESWRIINERVSPSEFGKILYVNWFRMDHKVKKLFPKEISHHSKMFIEVIESTVNLLSDLKSLIPKLISLGVRHIAYKIKPAYFESLTKALIQTISEVLAEDLNEEIKSAWRTAFEMIKMVMMMAMQKQQLTKGNQNFSRMTALLLAMSRHPSLEDSMEVSFDENYWRFWKAISTMEEDFSQSILHSDSIVRERVLNIYEAYIAKDCPNPIRISSEIRKEISNRVTNYFTASELLSVFDDAVDDIQLHLEDSAFPEFRSSVIEDVMKTWETIKGSLGQDQFGELLFKNFFKLVPEVENLFRNEISKHSTMVAGMLDLAIKSMQELAEIIPYLFHLGERHKSYGATPEYMKGFCDAFIFTLEEVLKDEFNSGISNSWNVLFLLISEIMLMGSKSITTDHSSSDIRESKSNSIDRDSRYSPKIENEKTRKSSRSVKRMLTRRKTWSSPDSMDLFKPASPAADRCIIS